MRVACGSMGTAAANEDLDSIVVIGLNLSYIVDSANESQLDATGKDAEALRAVE